MKEASLSYLCVWHLCWDVSYMPLNILYCVAHTDRQGATLCEEAETEANVDSFTWVTQLNSNSDDHRHKLLM